MKNKTADGIVYSVSKNEWYSFEEKKPPIGEFILLKTVEWVTPCIVNFESKNGFHIYCYKRKKVITSEYGFYLWSNIPDVEISENPYNKPLIF